jgi:hypothetical protein
MDAKDPSGRLDMQSPADREILDRCFQWSSSKIFYVTRSFLPGLEDQDVRRAKQLVDAYRKWNKYTGTHSLSRISWCSSVFNCKWNEARKKKHEKDSMVIHLQHG